MRAPHETTDRARNLRAEPSDAERVLWRHLRNRQLRGFKFRRQHPIGPFFADFACVEARLVIELDGGQHFEPAAQATDAARTAVLTRAGFTVLRFDNRQALAQTTAVLEAVDQWLRANGPHPGPLPQAGEGDDPDPLLRFEEGARPSASRPSSERTADKEPT